MTREFDIIKSLQDAGFKAFFVGGWVRDRVLRLHDVDVPKSQDIDIATSATPEEVERVFSDCKTDFVGRSFGVSLVDGVEVATFRVDKCRGLSDKNVSVEFVPTIEEDLARRDFTMNAIAFDPVTEVYIDPFNGINDTLDLRLRFVGEAQERIFEDPCRILRGLRFVARFNLTVPVAVLDVLRENSHLLNLIPRERFRLEILKAIKESTHPSRFFELAHKVGALRFIFPSLDDSWGVDHCRHHNEDLFEHAMLSGDFLADRDPILCLTGFLHDVGKLYTKRFYEETGDFRFRHHAEVGAEIVERELRDLHFSTDEIGLITGTILTHMRIVFGPQIRKRTTRRTLRALDELSVPLDWFIWVRIADNQGNLKRRRNPVEYEEDLRRPFIELENETPVFGPKNLALDGSQVMRELRISPGPRVGEILNHLVELVLDDPSLNTDENLRQIVRDEFL